MYLLIPICNNLYFLQTADVHLSIDLATDAGMIGLFLTFAVVVGILSGLYPSLYLSAYRPVVVLKGVSSIRGFSRLTLRKALTIVQCAFALLVMITAMMTYRQFEFMIHTDYGFNKGEVLTVPLRDVNYERVRNELQSHPDILAVTGVSGVPGTNDIGRKDVQSADMAMPISAGYLIADADLIGPGGIPLLAGRTFSPSFPTDRAEATLINAAAVQALGLGSPIEAVDAYIRIGGADFQVVGVTDNFHFSRIRHEIEPLIIRYDTTALQHVMIRIRPEKVQTALAHLESIWPSFNSVYPLAYRFYEDEIAADHEMRSFKDSLYIFGGLAGCSIVITMLGLLGLVTYATEVRLKEIGVRKVLGASVPTIMFLLSKDFLKLLAIAIAPTVPVAWALNNVWLSPFPYRVEMSPSVFIFAVGLTAGLLGLTIALQAFRGARTNPIVMLRQE
jgi:putative ABC transport system permease protein